jgi:hypothetical protein
LFFKSNPFLKQDAYTDFPTTSQFFFLAAQGYCRSQLTITMEFFPAINSFAAIGKSS